MAVRRLAEPALQPKSFAFTAENLDWAKDQIAKYPEGRQASAILPILWRAQEQAGGWLPQKAIEHVAAFSACRRSARSKSQPSTPCSIWSRSENSTSSSAAPRLACCAARTS